MVDGRTIYGCLTSVTYPDPATDAYTYDAVGNRLTKNSATYTYDAASQMTAADGVTYSYDNNGNQTGRASDTFAWNHENRLTSATIGSGTSTYTYNGNGVRDTRTTGTGTTTYTWDWGAGLPVVLKDDALNFVYGLGLIMATDGAQVLSYFMTDGLGSVTDVRDATGNAVDAYTYDVFGAIRSQTGASGNYWGFAGEQRDDESDYYYLRERYFDPVIGRFLGRDPLGSGYPYAANNPVNLTDPTGLYWIPCEGNPECIWSEDLGLPVDPPSECDAATNMCRWAGGFMSPLIGPPNKAQCGP
jgi:RHS repeat-associated protein